MGCISSKVLTRSLSFQGDLNQRLHRTANSVPVLEELFTSCNGSDQFLALVCTANTAASKPLTESFPLESNTGPISALEPTNTETINTWELMAGLEEGGEEKVAQPMAPLLLPSPQKVVVSLDVAMTKRSKSCHWFQEHEEFAFALGSFDGIQENGFSWSNKGMVRSRSFHTVEEYDAMVEKNWLSQARKIGFDDNYYGSVTKVKLHHSNTSFKKSHHAENNDSDIQKMNNSFSRNEDSVKEKTVTEETSVPSTSGLETKEVLPSPNSSSTIDELNIVNHVAQEGSFCEKALRRKAIAEGLKSLKIPSTIEFPAITSQWPHVGRQVYSPGAYVTPKFGSYALPNTGTGNECNESFIFNPELVTAFEECMQLLEAEEESILRHISEKLEEDGTKEEEAGEEIASNIQN